MVVAIALDGQTVAEYAASIGDEANNVSHRYRRAIKTLKKVFSEILKFHNCMDIILLIKKN